VRRVTSLLVLAAVFSGCGQSHVNEVLSRTGDNLGKLHSGDLTLRLVVSPQKGTRGRIGFELHGPFALRPGALPIAHVAYTQIAGAKEATATFISTGTKAYAEVNGKAYELPPSATEPIRKASGAAGSGGFGELRIGDWVKHPRVTGGGEIGGARTDHVSAGLDVVAAANGLLGLVRQLGRNTPSLRGDSAKQLQAAVKSSSFDLWSGHKDHLLRRLLLEANLGLSVPESLRRVLGNVVGARIDFELAVAKPNQPVSVAPPSNPLPSSALPRG
jgi:hypothetical protein